MFFPYTATFCVDNPITILTLLHNTTHFSLSQLVRSEASAHRFSYSYIKCW